MITSLVIVFILPVPMCLFSDLENSWLADGAVSPRGCSSVKGVGVRVAVSVSGRRFGIRQWVTHSTHVRSVLYGGAFSSSAVKRLITTSKRDARMTTRRGPTPMRRRCPMTRSIFRRPTPLTLIGDLAQRLTANFRYEKRKSGVCYRQNNKKKKVSVAASGTRRKCFCFIRSDLISFN